MKALFASALLLTLGACGSPKPDADADAGVCSVRAQTDIAFSQQEAPDRLVAQIIGPTCGRAVALLALYTADDEPVWAWAAPMTRAFGDGYLDADDEALAEFVVRWATVEPESTDAAPPWPANATVLPGAMQADLPRDLYEDIRARALPMVCHLTNVGRETCVYWEPAAAYAVRFYERPSRLAEFPEPPAESHAAHD